MFKREHFLCVSEGLALFSVCCSINNAVLHAYNCDTHLQFRVCPAQLVIADLRVQWEKRYIFSVLHQPSLFTMVPVLVDTCIRIHFVVFFSKDRCVH